MERMLRLDASIPTRVEPHAIRAFVNSSVTLGATGQTVPPRAAYWIEKRHLVDRGVVTRVPVSLRDVAGTTGTAGNIEFRGRATAQIAADRLLYVLRAKWLDNTLWFKVMYQNRTGWIPERIFDGAENVFVRRFRTSSMTAMLLGDRNENSVIQVRGGTSSVVGDVLQNDALAAASHFGGMHDNRLGLEDGAWVFVWDRNLPTRSAHGAVWVRVHNWYAATDISETMNVELLRFREVRALTEHVRVGNHLKITDVRENSTFAVRILSVYAVDSGHIDVTPLGNNDIATLSSFRDRYCFCSRPVWVTIGDRAIAAALHHFPHSAGVFEPGTRRHRVVSFANGGHICLHFHETGVSSETQRSNARNAVLEAMMAWENPDEWNARLLSTAHRNRCGFTNRDPNRTSCSNFTLNLERAL